MGYVIYNRRTGEHLTEKKNWSVTVKPLEFNSTTEAYLTLIDLGLGGAKGYDQGIRIING